MPEPRAEQILAAIASRCTAITIVNGYRQTVAAVKRRLQFVDQFDAFPAVLVLLGSDTLDYEEIGAGGVISGTLEVPIVLYDELSDTTELATKLLRLRADVEIALTTIGVSPWTPDLHLGLGADVEDVRRIGGSDIEEVVTDQWHRIEALDRYRVIYTYPLGTP